METVSIPGSFLKNSGTSGSVDFVPYVSDVAVIKGRASLDKNMISLITEGEKIMYVEKETIHLTPNQVLWISAGNVLFTERLGRLSRIKSTMIFFDNKSLQEASELSGSAAQVSGDSKWFELFDRDDFLHRFIESVNVLMQQGLLQGAMAQIKLNELLLYLASKHPGILNQFHAHSSHYQGEERIRRIMEGHMTKNLTVQELAFLCHMSLPTFRRKFEIVYQESPARWLQIQRLTLAADRLRSKTAKPGEVYLEAGYENHSSFSKAFRQYFGVLPKDYAH